MITKHVTIGLEVTDEFVRLLNSNVHLSGLRNKNILQPIDQLALVALLEMRGALEEQIDDAILPMWKDHIKIAPDVRKVVET